MSTHTIIELDGTPPEVTLIASEGITPFARITLSNSPAEAKLFLHSRAECDALVKAALAARDLLPEPAPDPATLNDALAEVAP